MHAPDFKMLRRNSLNAEVDFGSTDLDELEDTVVPSRISINECQMLKRVLGADKQDVLPRSCKTAAESTSKNRSFMTRLTHVTDSPDVAGRVSLSECHNLSDTLKMMPGGSTFVPFACSALMNAEEKALSERFEAENAKVYQRLKRRQTFVASQDWPPTAT